MSCRRIGESLNDRLIRNRLNCRYCCGYPGTFVDGIDEEVTNSANAGERLTANGHIRCPATADANYSVPSMLLLVLRLPFSGITSKTFPIRFVF